MEKKVQYLILYLVRHEVTFEMFMTVNHKLECVDSLLLF